MADHSTLYITLDFREEGHIRAKGWKLELCNLDKDWVLRQYWRLYFTPCTCGTGAIVTCMKCNKVGITLFWTICTTWKQIRPKKEFLSSHFFSIAFLGFLLYKLEQELTKLIGKITKGSASISCWILNWQLDLYFSFQNHEKKVICF